MLYKTFPTHLGLGNVFSILGCGVAIFIIYINLYLLKFVNYRINCLTVYFYLLNFVS